MFQDSMPPVLGLGIGERKALYSQTWEEEMSKKLILRCLLEEKDMSGDIKRENVEGDEEARHTLGWKKGKDKGCVSCL
jgi:hypothetical protein